LINSCCTLVAVSTYEFIHTESSVVIGLEVDVVAKLGVKLDFEVGQGLSMVGTSTFQLVHLSLHGALSYRQPLQCVCT